MKVHLVCGLPASGKSWVCNQLTDEFHYVRSDDYKNLDKQVLALKKAKTDKPLLTDCPFGETELRDKLKREGFTVVPYFITEPIETVVERYEGTRGKTMPRNVFTRSFSIGDKAKEWNAVTGSSTEILRALRKV